ncbi:MAG TPA: DUF4136 domain-containing protein [Gemmatimonadaceae bacterium]|nr:DUF4136 domain-containing protein [Gemmatimonadaceae bacterium]
MTPRFRSILQASTLAFAMGVSACNRGIEVRTMSGPDARFDDLRAFRVLPGPSRRDGLTPAGTDDPMISNSIANRALRDRITTTLQERGYRLDERDPDFGVAFYATVKEKLDVTTWDYGYPASPRWPRYPSPMLVQYTEGTVVIDMVRLEPRELLWRGEGKAELSDDPVRNIQQLADAAAAIIGKFPEAPRRIVAQARR